MIPFVIVAVIAVVIAIVIAYSTDVIYRKSRDIKTCLTTKALGLKHIVSFFYSMLSSIGK